MEIRYCEICNSIIPEGRIKALPFTTRCIKHSYTEKKMGFRVITGKTTYLELDIVDADTYKHLTRYDRKNHSASHMKFSDNKKDLEF